MATNQATRRADEWARIARNTADDPTQPFALRIARSMEVAPVIGGGGTVGTTRVTTTYTILVTDNVVFCNTDAGVYAATLPAGVAGQTYRIINSGSSANNLNLTPNGTEHLFGANSAHALASGASVQITYNTTDGWY